MKITIDGSDIRSEADLHQCLAASLALGDYYGRNLNALWDRLTADVERPLEIVWINASKSREHLGETQDRIEELLRDVEVYDKNLKLLECFRFRSIE